MSNVVVDRAELCEEVAAFLAQSEFVDR